MFEPLQVKAECRENLGWKKKHPAMPEISLEMKNVECAHIFIFFFSLSLLRCRTLNKADNVDITCGSKTHY